jgi:non-heme chloroperoxidase
MDRRNVLLAGSAALLAQTIVASAATNSKSKSTTRSTHMTHADGNIFTTPDGVDIYYKDWGSGQPIVFSHGWPLSGDDWDAQMLFFLDKGFSCHCP